MEAIIASVITGMITAIASIVASHMNNMKTIAVLNERMDNMHEKINKLEKKQDEANNVKVRLAIVEHEIYNMKGGEHNERQD